MENQPCQTIYFIVKITTLLALPGLVGKLSSISIILCPVMVLMGLQSKYLRSSLSVVKAVLWSSPSSHCSLYRKLEECSKDWRP